MWLRWNITNTSIKGKNWGIGWGAVKKQWDNAHNRFIREKSSVLKKNAWALMHLPRSIMYSLFAPHLHFGLLKMQNCVRTSSGSVRRALNYRQTHAPRTDSITSTADTGGKKDGDFYWLIFHVLPWSALIQGLISENHTSIQNCVSFNPAFTG